MSSLNTLLEAARFLELQEQQQQHQATVEAALATMKPISTVAVAPAPPQVVTASHGVAKPITTSPQAVVISSNNITSTILQGQASISFPSTTQAQVRWSHLWRVVSFVIVLDRCRAKSL